MLNITIIAGARPNFMKIAPIIHEINRRKNLGVPIGFRLVHTGQHYDQKMSDNFFSQLGIPEPDINLKCGGGTQAEQTASIMVSFEKDLLAHLCDLVLVVGDVTSSMACSIVAKKLNIPVAHVEAGIRSGDLSMPEEINRIVTDSITDYFFTTTEMAGANLVKCGASSNRIFFVGNTMIDTLLANIHNFYPPKQGNISKIITNKYFVLTLHRPANVDNPEKLIQLLNTINNATDSIPVLFPAHPRTAKVLEGFEISTPNIHLCEPLSYLEFNYLVKNANGVITDSGGITEEASVLNVPCITLRNSTERPETVEYGTNILIGDHIDSLPSYIRQITDGKWKQYKPILKWDGNTSARIVEALLKLDIGNKSDLEDY